jgi:hypothetical protein
MLRLARTRYFQFSDPFVYITASVILIYKDISEFVLNLCPYKTTRARIKWYISY